MNKRSRLLLKHNGFTFVELLIALTIFAIVASGIYATLHTGFKIWSRGNVYISRNQSMRVFFDVLSSELVNAILYEPIGHTYLSGEVSFPAIIDVSTGNLIETELVSISYLFNSGEGVITRRCATLENGFDHAEAEEYILLDDVESCHFSYCLEPAAEGEEYEWSEDWDEEYLPRAIKINLVMRGNQGQEKEQFEKVIFLPQGKVGVEE